MSPTGGGGCCDGEGPLLISSTGGALERHAARHQHGLDIPILKGARYGFYQVEALMWAILRAKSFIFSFSDGFVWLSASPGGG